MKRSLILFGTLVATVFMSFGLSKKNTIEANGDQVALYKIDFKDNGTSSDGSKEVTITEGIIESGSDYVSSVVASKVYNAKTDWGIKLGTSKAKGSLQINLSSSGKVSASKIDFECASYDPGISMIVTINGSNVSEIALAQSFSSYEVSLNDSLESIKVESKNASKNRFYLKSLNVYGDSQTQEKEISSIGISGKLNKSAYVESESFDPTGLTVTATYDDESTADITSKVTWSPSPLSVGNTSVTATYVEGGKTFTAIYEGITVSKKEIEIIDVSGKLNKTQYFVGETFDPSGLTVTGMDNIGNEFDLTDKVTWNLSTFDKEATYSSVTATYTSEDGLIITDDAKVDIEVKEKVLDGILVDTSNMKLDYTSFDTELDTTGLVVEACYPFDTYEDVTDKVTLSKPDFTKLGKQTITVAFEGKNDTFEINVTKYPETSYTYIDSSINEGYYKVTEALEDWSGTYLIAYCPDDANANVFSGVDEAGGYKTTTISNGLISLDNSLVSIAIKKYEDGYAIKVNGGINDGKYISGSSDKNSINFDDVESVCYISFINQNDVSIVSNTSYLRYNSSNTGGAIFRFYKSGTYNRQKSISLFKYESPKLSAVASNELLDAAYASLEELEKCDPNGVNSAYDWTVIENNFTNITDEEKANLKTALSDGNGNVIERFLEKYDYLVEIKNQNDFLNREPSKQSNLNPSSPLPSKTSTTVTYTCVFGISVITIASFLLLNRKRRHN